jgi:hypothetical protein
MAAQGIRNFLFSQPRDKESPNCLSNH